MVAVEISGTPVDPEFLASLRVIYGADGTWSVLLRSVVVAEGRSTHHQDQTSKTFEMETLGSEDIEPRRYVGIYRIDGDTRQLWLVSKGSPRPDDFVAPRLSGRTRVTLRRSRNE